MTQCEQGHFYDGNSYASCPNCFAAAAQAIPPGYFASTAASADPAPPPAYTLNSPGAVTLATALGGPIAGALLLADNYRKLRDKRAAWIILAIGIGVLAVAFAAAYFFPSNSGINIWGTPLAVGMVIAFRNVAKNTQGPQLDHHLRMGGSFASLWKAFGIGMAFLALQGIPLWMEIAGNITNPHVTIGENDVVNYTGSATKEEANTLGEALKSAGFFVGKGFRVTLDQQPRSGATISYMVRDGAWDEPQMVFAFSTTTRNVASSVGGFPMKMRLLNSASELKRELPLDQMSIGNDGVYGIGSVSREEIAACVTQLKDAGFFIGRGFIVSIWKGDGLTTTIEFIVKDGIWNQPSMVADFSELGRKLAKPLGGFPVKVLLANSASEIKKEIVLQPERGR